jgi:hypothetical protein
VIYRAILGEFSMVAAHLAGVLDFCEAFRTENSAAGGRNGIFLAV